MAWQPDPLLLELFEAVQRELATALDTRERQHEAQTDESAAAAHATKIGSLRSTLAALEGALERVQSRIVH